MLQYRTSAVLCWSGVDARAHRIARAIRVGRTNESYRASSPHDECRVVGQCVDRLVFSGGQHDDDFSFVSDQNT